MTYHDEDGLTLSEYFGFHSEGARRLFQQRFIASSLARPGLEPEFATLAERGSVGAPVSPP